MQDAPFKSDLALLDVKKGRGSLAKKIRAGGKVRVRVDMTIEDSFGYDDGVSATFSATVHTIKVFAPRKRGGK